MKNIIAMKCDTTDMEELPIKATEAVQGNFSSHAVLNIIVSGGDTKAEIEAVGKVIAANANVKLF